MLISIQNDREWRILAENVLGDDALAADPNFATNVERVKRRAETDGQRRRRLRVMDVAPLVEKLARRRYRLRPRQRSWICWRGIRI